MPKSVWNKSKRREVYLPLKQVEYLGHQISSKRLHTAPTKVKAIQAAPTPANTLEVRPFLGLLHYYTQTH